MRILSAFLALIVICSVRGGDPDVERVRKHFRSDDYTVTWGTPAAFEPNAELEIGDGHGHGGTLGWLRFVPSKDGVDLLSIQFNEGWHPSESTWPPDRAPVTVKRGRLKSDVYAALLSDLAVVDSAKLKPAQGKIGSSSSNFWVYARLTANTKTYLDLEWAGYEGTLTAVEFAKPRAAVRLCDKTVEGLDLKEDKLTEAERAWASAKFIRDWKKFKGLEYHWWVRERYIETIGVVGDKAAFPVLREILVSEPPKGKPREASDGRCVYQAINAVTRLTKKDVRGKPVEEMDIEKTRLKVLELIKDQ